MKQTNQHNRLLPAAYKVFLSVLNKQKSMSMFNVSMNYLRLPSIGLAFDIYRLIWQNPLLNDILSEIKIQAARGRQ